MAYLLEKGAHRVLEGRETEPFRIRQQHALRGRSQATSSPMLKYMWSADSMYTLISATHKVDTTPRRADLSSLLRLPLKFSREKMLEHYEQYSNLSAEAIISGVRIDDWEKSERFLMSLGDDLESLKIQWAVLPEQRQVWTELVRIYKSLADRRGLEHERESQAAPSDTGPTASFPIFPNDTHQRAIPSHAPKRRVAATKAKHQQQ